MLLNGLSILTELLVKLKFLLLWLQNVSNTENKITTFLNLEKKLILCIIIYIYISDTNVYIVQPK